MASIEEIKQDIEDTENEVFHLKEELNVLNKNIRENRVQIYLTEGNIKQREEFINYLYSLLKEKENE